MNVTNACDQVAIGFGFVYDWLRWCEIFKPITERTKVKPKQFSDYFRHSIENRTKYVILNSLIAMLFVQAYRLFSSGITRDQFSHVTYSRLSCHYTR